MKKRYECRKEDCGRKCVLEVESLEEALDIVPLYCNFKPDRGEWEEV